MAQKVSGIAGMPWTCIVVDERLQRTQNADEFHIDSAFNRLYVMLFFMSILVFLLAFSYKRKFNATDLGVDISDDAAVIARMQKVCACALHVSASLRLCFQILEPSCRLLPKEQRISLAAKYLVDAKEGIDVFGLVCAVHMRMHH